MFSDFLGAVHPVNLLGGQKDGRANNGEMGGE